VCLTLTNDAASTSRLKEPSRSSKQVTLLAAKAMPRAVLAQPSDVHAVQPRNQSRYQRGAHLAQTEADLGE